MFWSPAISLQHRTISYFFSCQTRVERETVKCLETHLRKDRSGSFIFWSLQNAKQLMVMSSRFPRTCFIAPRVIVKFHWASSSCPGQGESPPVWQSQVFLMAGMPWVYCVMHPENYLVLRNQEQVKAPWLTAMHDPLVFSLFNTRFSQLWLQARRPLCTQPFFYSSQARE